MFTVLGYSMAPSLMLALGSLCHFLAVDVVVPAHQQEPLHQQHYGFDHTSTSDSAEVDSHPFVTQPFNSWLIDCDRWHRRLAIHGSNSWHFSELAL